VMLFSTGAFAQDAHGNQYHFVNRQAFWLVIGFAVCLVASRIDYHFWQRTWYIWFLLSAILLILCFIPPIGQRINGSSRWINLRVFTFQPSELGKFAAIVALAWWFSRDESAAREVVRGFLYPGILSGTLMALIAPEVDMGTTALIGATTFAMMFIAGTRLTILVPMVLIGFCGLYFAMKAMPERAARFSAFLDPESHPADAYQQVQGLIALGSGGVEGLGLGNGRQKMAYLPYAHTDFIFAPIGEELGLRVTLGVVFTYIVIIMAGGIIALRARDRFGVLLGSGLVIIIALQAAVNIGVVTCLLPNKGLPLPLISYGGSNLVFCLLSVGILINIYRLGTSDREVQSLVVQHALQLNRKKGRRF
jgi:cell division protein FtsW